MKTSVQKWGNSLAVRIPRGLVEESRLSAGARVEVLVEDGRLVVVPLAPLSKEQALEELVSRITDDNRHGETDWGPPVGREAW